MAGIIKQQMQEPPQPAAGAGPSPPGEGGLAEDLQSPEQGEALERVVLAGMKMLYDEKGSATIVQQIQQAQNKAEAIAQATFTIMQLLDEKSGGKIPEDVLIPAAAKILELVTELAERSGAVKPDQNLPAQALQQLIAIAIERGIIDPAEIEQMMAEIPSEEQQAMVAEQEAIASGGARPVAEVA